MVSHFIGSCIKWLVQGTIVLILLTQMVYAENNLKISAPPSIWVQEQGKELTGPIIDLLKDILSDFNINVTYVPLPWARAITQMKSGRLDMIPVIFYTSERSKFMEFSEPYAEVPTSIFVSKGQSFTFKSVRHLEGRKGLIMRGDSISQEFNKHRNTLDLNEIAEYAQMIQMLSDQRADYAVAAQYGFIIQALKMGNMDQIDLLPNPVSSRNLYFAFSKKSSHAKYLSEINKRILKLKADGEMKKIVEKTIIKAAKQ